MPVVQQGLQDLADDFRAHGPGYARRYLEYMTGERTTPPMPKGVHPKVAAAIRDVVLDQALAAGMKGMRIR